MELIDVELDKDYYSWNDEKKAIYCRDQLLLLHNKETAVTAYINNVLNMYSLTCSRTHIITHSPIRLFTVKMKNI